MAQIRSIRVIGAYIHKAVMVGEGMRPAAKSSAAKPRRRVSRASAAKPYHHGDLRRVLIDAALQLVGEGGPEAVSVREAARRAGVSPGAPFRHFPSRDALMQAVAEEAQRRFRAEIEAGLAGAPAGDPLGRFRCLGLAYLRWAMRNPTHFEIISSRRFFDHDRAVAVSRDNAELIALTERTLAEAFAAGQLRTGGPQAGPDRRPGAGLWLRPDEYRRPFSALGRGRHRGRADRRGDPRPLYRRDRQAGVTRPQ
jgi:AcrR family transcriptional regulator